MLKTLFFFILINEGVHSARAASKYDMSCDCGKRMIDWKRIWGGVHGIPWYVLFLLPSRSKCGGALINKFWVLSEADFFCEFSPCKRMRHRRSGRKWRTVKDRDLHNIQVSGPSDSLHCSPFTSTRFLSEIWMKMNGEVQGSRSSGWWSWWSTTSGS